MTSDSGFKLGYDGTGSAKYPHGYWYACTNDGNYDAVGATIETALANLITELTGAVAKYIELLGS